MVRSTELRPERRSRPGRSSFQTMARLKTIPPLLAPGRAPLDRGGRGELARDAERRTVHAWRSWYSTKRWRELRLVVLRREGWQCSQTGVMLIGKAPAPNSPVVDHKVPHNGDPALFWDPDNLQAVSKAWHDTVKQAQERRGDF